MAYKCYKCMFTLHTRLIKIVQCIHVDFSSVVTCPTLTNPLNGYIDGTNFTVFSEIKYSCNAGFKLVGKTETSCQIDSTWTNPPPECKS